MARDGLLFMATLCQRAEGLDDMLELMKEVACLDQSLAADERALFAIASKRVAGCLSGVWRELARLEAEEEVSHGQSLSILRDYKAKVKGELSTCCQAILQILEEKLIPRYSKTDYDAMVFCLNLMGYYHRIIADFAKGELKETATKKAQEVFAKGSAIAGSHLHTTHPLRLEVALNYSLFCWDLLKES